MLDYYLVFIHLFMWLFILKRLIVSRKIEYIIETSSLYSFLIFVILGLIISFFRGFKPISFLSFVLAGALFRALPCGFNEDGVFIRGKKYAYKQIVEWLSEEKDNSYRLSFHTRYRLLVLVTDIKEKEFILAYRYLWQKKSTKIV